MALIKTTKIDKVEFVGEWKTLQVRHLTEVKEGDETLASSYSRDSYEISVGIAGLPVELQPYATGVWTDGLVAEWETKAAELVAKMEAEQASLEETA